MNQLIIDLNVIRRMQITCRQQTGVENKKAPTNGRSSIYPEIAHD